MSGADSRYLRAARMLGADETLSKPASNMEVLGAVERVLGPGLSAVEERR
jgi:hypothetical protein